MRELSVTIPPCPARAAFCPLRVYAILWAQQPNFGFLLGSVWPAVELFLQHHENYGRWNLGVVGCTMGKYPPHFEQIPTLKKVLLFGSYTSLLPHWRKDTSISLWGEVIKCEIYFFSGSRQVMDQLNTRGSFLWTGSVECGVYPRGCFQMFAPVIATSRGLPVHSLPHKSLEWKEWGLGEPLSLRANPLRLSLLVPSIYWCSQYLRISEALFFGAFPDPTQRWRRMLQSTCFYLSQRFTWWSPSEFLFSYKILPHELKNYRESNLSGSVYEGKFEEGTRFMNLREASKGTPVLEVLFSFFQPWSGTSFSTNACGLCCKWKDRCRAFRRITVWAKVAWLA